MDGQGILLNTFQNYYNKKSNLVSKVAVCSNYPRSLYRHTDHLPSVWLLPDPTCQKDDQGCVQMKEKGRKNHISHCSIL